MIIVLLAQELVSFALLIGDDNVIPTEIEIPPD